MSWNKRLDVTRVQCGEKYGSIGRTERGCSVKERDTSVWSVAERERERENNCVHGKLCPADGWKDKFYDRIITTLLSNFREIRCQTVKRT